MMIPTLLVTVVFLFEVCYCHECKQYKIWLDPNLVTRAEGRALCVEQGGDIAVINTDSRKDAALRAMKRGSNAKEAWIGLKKRANDVMRWENGDAVSLTGFSLLKHNADTCGILGEKGTTDTAPCSNRKATLCLAYEQLSVNHMTMYRRHVTSSIASREVTMEISLVQCVARCQRSCLGCKFLSYTSGKCDLYDDNVTKRDFNVASQGSAIYQLYSSANLDIVVIQGDPLG